MSQPTPPAVTDLVDCAYAAFNAHDIGAHPDVQAAAHTDERAEQQGRAY